MKLPVVRTIVTWVSLVGALLLLAGYLVAAYNNQPAIVPVHERLLTPHDQLLAIALPDSASGIITGSDGLILRTTDAAKHWSVVPSPTRETLTTVSFANSQEGVIGGSRGTIVTSIDGGRRWIQHATGTEQRLLKVQALDAEHEYATGAFGTFLTSTDGGNKWLSHKFDWNRLIPKIISEFGYLEPNLNSVFFVTPSVGWIVGEFGLILHTADGGETWQAAQYGQDLPQLYDIVFKDPQSGWIVGQSGALLETTDGGKSWRHLFLTQKTLEAIAIRNDGVIAVGDGLALNLSPAASNVVGIPSLTGATLSGIALNSSEAVAVGAFGTILYIPAPDLVNSDEKPTSLTLR